MSGRVVTHPPALRNFTWEKHCGGLFDFPVAAWVRIRHGQAIIPKHMAIPPRDLSAHALPTGHYVRRLEGEMGLRLDHPPKLPRSEAEPHSNASCTREIQSKDRRL